MGQSSFAMTPSSQSALLSYQLVSYESDKRFGEIGIFKKNENGSLVWMKEVPLEDEIAVQKIKQHTLSPEYRSGVFITQQVHLDERSTNGLCGTCASVGKAVVVMQHFERDLEGEILRRAEDLVIKSSS